MALKHLLRTFLITVAALSVLACTEKPEPEEEVKIISSNVSVPSVVELEEGSDAKLVLHGKTNITTDNQVVMRSAANQDYLCPIISIMDGISLEFKLADGVTNGTYKVYIRHKESNFYVGMTTLNILKPLKIEPGDGTSIYGLVSCDGNGIPDVLVSDGAQIVKTNSDGIYQIKSDKRWKYVFVIIPGGYEVPTQGVLPQFHATLSQGATVPERKDFELIKTDNDNFTLFALGDMHLANRTNDIKQFNSVANTLNQAISQASGKCYGITLGDMTWDLYWYSNSYQFPQYLQTANTYIQNITIFHTMGNHDNDMESVGDYDKAFKYTRDIAPTFYSFNLGKIHFVVMDNIDYNDVGTGKDLRGQYKRNYTAEQMEWLAKDLSFVSKDTPVFITSHAPISAPSGASGWNNNYLNGANAPGEANMNEFLSAVQGYNVHFLSGHTHNIFNRKHSDSFSEHNQGAVCASWWWSGYLTEGIHLSQDGAPGGFGVWKINGTSVSQSFRAAGHDDDYQFRAYDMNKVKDVIKSSLGGNHKDFSIYSTTVQSFHANTILVNVWDYDPDWKISISENGQELNVVPIATYDPLHVVALSAPRCKDASANSTPSFLTSSWTHFFEARASSANSPVTIKVTDRNGKVYTETMNRPKAFNVSEYKNQ